MQAAGKERTFRGRCYHYQKDGHVARDRPAAAAGEPAVERPQGKGGGKGEAKEAEMPGQADTGQVQLPNARRRTTRQHPKISKFSASLIALMETKITVSTKLFHLSTVWKLPLTSRNR